MPVRGRRSHPNIRQFEAPTAGAPEAAFVGVGSGELPEADADALIAAFRVRAYSEARRRQRQARARESAAHWSFVAKIIARRTGAGPGVEPSLRRAIDADLMSDRQTSPARLLEPFFEVRPLEELKRILDANLQRFRLQFFAVAGELGPTIVAETDIRAADTSDAIHAAAEAPWPPRAIGVRVLDREGREIFEQLKADRR
jgi:hypothetical protein